MDTVIYRSSGQQESVSNVYMQQILHAIISDTTNEFDVYDDVERHLIFILITDNKFLIIDKNVAINNNIVNDYIIRDRAISGTDPFGLSFTLKSNRATVRNLADVLFAYAYDRGSVTQIAQLFMFKTEINAKAVFTTPLFLASQPHIFLRYGPWLENGQLINPADRFINNGYGNKGLMPWTEIVEKRGNITGYLSLIPSTTSYPNPDPNAFNHGLITIKTPGVYLLNGMVQLDSVTSEIAGMEVSLRVNKNASDYQHASKVGPVKDGGVPYTFCVFITESDINASNPAIQKVQGEAYLQLNVAYDKGSSDLNSLRLVKNDARFCWCTVTHLG